MAGGDWIKMRTWIAKDPKVLAIADFLSTHRPFVDWLTRPCGVTVRGLSADTSADSHVPRPVTVAVTVCGLVQVWGVTRPDGWRDGDDLVVDVTTPRAFDEIAGFPGLGAAMEFVGWAKYDPDTHSTRLPKFFVVNVDTADLKKQKDAERKRRQRHQNGGTVRGHSADTSADTSADCPADVTHREEKRREEEKEDRQTPLPLVRPDSGQAAGEDPGSRPAGRDQPEPFDPLRAQERDRKRFEAIWRGSGLRAFSRLTPTLQSRLAALLLDEWWAANYPAALEKAGQIPFLATGLGRQAGPYDVGAFLRDGDEVRKILDGVYDPRPAAGGAAPAPDRRQAAIDAAIAEAKQRRVG